MYDLNLPFSDYAENLAYEVKGDFGREFKTWMSEDRNRNAGSRVKVREKINQKQIKFRRKRPNNKNTLFFYIAGTPMGSDVALAPWGFGHTC